MATRSQPVPAVTDADVDRIVRRDFLPAAVPDAFAALAGYGTQPWHGEVDRVRLAALKLAAGNLERLRTQIAAASTDFRDVLAAAEYPVFFRTVAPGQEGVVDTGAAIDADWLQYRAWLRR